MYGKIGKKRRNVALDLLKCGQSSLTNRGVGCCVAGMEEVCSPVRKNGHFGDKN